MFLLLQFFIKILLQLNIKGIIVSLSKGVFTKLQNMIIIFSILFFSSIFTTNISGFKDPNLPEEFFSKWENSQVFIYYKSMDKINFKKDFFQKFNSEYPYPNCFGNLLTAKLVLTATSCFIHIKAFVEALNYDQEVVTTITEKLNGKLPIVKANFANIIVAKVTYQYK